MNNKIPKIIQNYFNYLTIIQGRSSNTIYSYKLDLMLFFNFLKSEDKFKDLDIDENFMKIITLEDLYNFLAYVKIERNNNSFTRSRKIATLRSFFNYLESKIKIITYNPCRELESPKRPSKQINYLTLQEAKHLLSSIDGRNKERDFCMITLFLNCGLRLN